MAKEKDATSQGSPRGSERRSGLSAFDDASGPEGKGSTSGEEAGGALPDFIRRAMAFGFSGFFATEEAMRRALGDTMPKDWIDFAAEQSDRTRDELTDRFAKEFGKILEQVDFVQLMSQLLEGRSVEVSASIRLGPDRSEEAESESGASAGKGERNFRTDLKLSTRNESSASPSSSGPQERPNSKKS